VFALALAMPSIGRARPEGFFVAMIDVGRGSALYAEWPDGRNLVFDCGSLDHRDVGATVVAPYLWSRRVRQVDTLVLSHGDADHVNGAFSLIERLRVRRLVVSKRLAPEIIDRARAAGLEIIVVERSGPQPVEIAPGVEVLGPPPWEKYGGTVRENESSVVLRLDGRVLVTGDIEERGTLELLELKEALATPVLVVPHHGKGQDLHRALALAVSPRIALVSAPEGYFSQDVVGNLERTCRVYRTGRDGCIEMTLRGETTEIRTFQGR
jgi:competence protein ComEC